MLRISDLVAAEVRASPFLEKALADGIVNHSALARRLRPAIERALLQRVSVAAITMALRRLRPTVLRRTSPRTRGRQRIRDITVRSGLTEFTYHNSPTIRERQRALIGRLARAHDTFLTSTQGVSEVMLIVSSGAEKLVAEVMRGERLLAMVHGLSALVIRLAAEVVRTPGVYYGILKELAWQGVNVVDVVSTNTEFTIVVENPQVEMAFAILRRLASE
jgi:aspartokinase